MALFTAKADADVPLLTQFYQVEVPTDNSENNFRETELGIWINRVMEWDGYRLRDYHAEGGFNSSNYLDFADFKRLALYHKVVCDLMDAAVDCIVANPSFVKLFNVWQAECHSGPPELKWSKCVFQKLLYPEADFDDLEKINATIPVDTLIITNDTPMLSPVQERIDAVLIEQLTQSLTAQGRGVRGIYRGLSRCDECNNPFVVLKTGQRFCSTRHRQRQGQRERMRALFARP